MEKQLEHKIKQAFQKKDANVSYNKKDELWERISKETAQSKGVAIFWRVAAIFLVLVSVSGLFAAVVVFNNQNKKLTEIENRNIKLQQVADSLLNIKPEKITEIQIVEKEKLVYKEVLVPVENKQTYDIEIVNLENEIEKLNDQLLLSKQNLQLTKDSLLFAREESKKQHIPEKKKPNFQLKPEKVKDKNQPNLIEQSPKMKLQIFKNQSNNMKFDTNSTLLKK